MGMSAIKTILLQRIHTSVDVGCRDQSSTPGEKNFFGDYALPKSENDFGKA
jgi:hypothetical protein